MRFQEQVDDLNMNQACSNDRHVSRPDFDRTFEGQPTMNLHIRCLRYSYLDFGGVSEKLRLDPPNVCREHVFKGLTSSDG